MVTTGSAGVDAGLFMIGDCYICQPLLLATEAV